MTNRQTKHVFLLFRSVTLTESIFVLELWRKAGANFNYAECDGRTPLIVAVSNAFEDKVYYLVHNGAKIQKAGPMGKTALDLAKELNNVKILKILNDYLEGN